MTRTMIRRIAAAAFVAAGVIGAIGAGTAASAASRPFKGTAHGGVTGGAGPFLFLDSTGNATHLGKFTRHETVSLAALPAISGDLDFVAANGDVLHASFNGVFTSLVPPLAANGTYTISGGSGRFADATGTATFDASGPNFGDVSISFNGTIDY